MPIRKKTQPSAAGVTSSMPSVISAATGRSSSETPHDNGLSAQAPTSDSTSEQVIVARLRVRTPAVTAQPPAATALPVPTAASTAKGKRASAKKAGKKQPTGDYETGYCRAPEKHRFDGSKPGPGRPRGSISQDVLLRKHLSQRRSVAIEGKSTKVQARELLIMLRVKEALSGNRHAADYVLGEAARLFNERGRLSGEDTASSPVDVDAHDQAILDALRAALIAGGVNDGQSDDAPGATDPDGEGGTP